ncbi:hypothetical protein [Brumimicrobium aurantiacum]|uniref:Uncharacterized protein n=1 Tax=Brumimicrobium aurantiacum TaxID=1737063 RepID=A0A3E1EUW1_9FLAO|nr:hypothetical protein [Brumimicrobium aurantiacum]RFC53351.1 hypothetical protein DXU93_13035 [Brumimicrobium aurantiacum]
MKSTLFLILLLGTFLLSCNQEIEHQTTKSSNDTELKSKQSKSYFIQAPLKEMDIRFENFTLKAEQGDTLYAESGSILIFPKHAFLDKQGAKITGEIKVQYREFTNPVDFFLAGIPLEYDSLGVSYDFESSGMCEVLAFKNENPVFVNPERKPEINMVSGNSSSSHNIYYLDTVQKNWIYREKSNVTDVNATLEIEKSTTVPPSKPEKADDKNPIINISIDPRSFEELMVYDNLKFQLDQTENSFKPEDANEIWKKVELKRSKDKGKYKVNFSNNQRKVSYLAKPVLEGEDYDKALQVYDKKIKTFKQKQNERHQNEAKIKAAIKEQERVNTLIKKRNEKQRIRNKQQREKNEKINQAIIADNKKRQKEYQEKRNAIEKQNSINKELNAQYEKVLAREEAKAKDLDANSQLIRSFSIDGFGIWNCDEPFTFETFNVIAQFVDEEGNQMDLSNSSIIIKGFNGVLSNNRNILRIPEQKACFIFAVYDKKIAYLTFEQFRDLKLSKETSEFTFKLKTVPKDKNNYAYLKSLISEN